MAWIERQLPEADEVFLDHVGWFVPDLDGARRALHRLGFVVSPRNLHYNADPDGNLVPAGTANRLVTPALGYLEFLAASGDTPLARQLRTALQRYPGIHLIAFGAADPYRVEKRLTAAGLDLQPTVRLRRPLEPTAGAPVAEFTVLRAAPGAMPEGRIQFCAHHTPELVWQSGGTVHRNTVDALTDVLLVCEDRTAAVKRYELFTGREARREADDLDGIELDRGRLTLASAGAAAKLLPGFAAPSLPFGAAVALRCTDLDAARATLQRAGVEPIIDRRDLLGIGPADGLGAFMFIHTRGDLPVWPCLSQRE